MFIKKAHAKFPRLEINHVFVDILIGGILLSATTRRPTVYGANSRLKVAERLLGVEMFFGFFLIELRYLNLFSSLELRFLEGAN